MDMRPARPVVPCSKVESLADRNSSKRFDKPTMTISSLNVREPYQYRTSMKQLNIGARPKQVIALLTQALASTTCIDQLFTARVIGCQNSHQRLWYWDVSEVELSVVKDLGWLVTW